MAMEAERSLSAAAVAAPKSAELLRWIHKWFNDVKNHKSTECAFRFGLVTDSQYADINDGTSFMGVKRYYRNSLVMLKRAFECWNEGPCAISFIAQLGDLIDGQANDGKGGTAKAVAELEKVMATKIPVYNLIGNHELYNFRLPSKVPLFKPELYYSWMPHPGWRCICLNPFDISTICADAKAQQAAWDVIRANNPNCHPTKNEMKAGNWYGGLSGIVRRFVPFNGGVGGAQLAWLAKELQAAVAAKQRIIIFSHVPLDPHACQTECLLFNFPQVIALLDRHAKGHVALVLCGHDHDGGYHYDDARGIYHITVEAPLETDPKAFKCCHALVEVTEKSIIVRGAGSVPSRMLPLRPLPSATAACVHGSKCRLEADACAKLHPQSSE